MRANVALALLAAATQVLADAQPKQLLEPVLVAVAARQVEPECESALCKSGGPSALKDRTPPAAAVISDTEPESRSSWKGINTTVTVEAGAWSGNATNTPATPLPTDEAETTDSEPAEVTGGALPQPMKASAAGLLGFFIMSLVML